MTFVKAYIVKVLAGIKSNTTVIRLHDIRKKTYTSFSTTKGIDAIPPTSSEVLFPSKCIVRCHQTFSDCVSVLASVTNDVVVRVLDLRVYYFVIRVNMHVGHKSKTEGIISYSVT